MTVDGSSWEVCLPDATRWLRGPQRRNHLQKEIEIPAEDGDYDIEV